jgi:Fe-S cluster assembly protein SufD
MGYLDHYNELISEEIESDKNFYFMKTVAPGANFFSENGFPLNKKGNERWKYLDLRNVTKSNYLKSDYEKRKSDNFNSVLEKLAPWGINIVQDEILIVGDDDNYLAGSNFIEPEGIGASSPNKTIIGEFAIPEEDGFIALNAALADITSFWVNEKFSLDALNIIFAGQSEEERLTTERMCIKIHPNTNLTINEIHFDSNFNTLNIPVLEIFLDKNSRLIHNKIILGSSKDMNFNFTRVFQEEGSYYKNTSFCQSPLIGSNDIKVIMGGENSECDLRGIYFTNQTSQFNTHITVDHLVPNCKSNQFYKGVLSDDSKAVFSGKIFVEKGAQKTYATQKDLNLIMSKGAEINTKPSLEIYADDVQCYHGATAGHVDENTLYYMMSRGIKKEIATQMLVRGFVDEIIDEISDKKIKNLATNQIGLILPNLSF